MVGPGMSWWFAQEIPPAVLPSLPSAALRPLRALGAFVFGVAVDFWWGLGYFGGQVFFEFGLARV